MVAGHLVFFGHDDGTNAFGGNANERKRLRGWTDFLMYWNRYSSEAYHRYRSPTIPRCMPRFTRDIAVDE